MLSGPPSKNSSPVSLAWSNQKCYFSPLDGMVIHCKVCPQDFTRLPWWFLFVNLYSWVEKGTVNLKDFSQFLSLFWPSQLSNPGLSNPESSTLTIMPIWSPNCFHYTLSFISQTVLLIHSFYNDSIGANHCWGGTGQNCSANFTFCNCF